jgi:homoserine O-acetyltransferase
MAGYFAPLDPNDLLAMAWKWQRGDVSRMTGSAMAVCAVRGITSDLFVNQFINR